MVACLGDVQHRRRRCGLAGGQQQGSGTTFQRGNALFGHVLRGVHDAGVDISKLRQGEQVLGALGAVKHVRSRAVDGSSPCRGGVVGAGTRMDLLGFKFPIGHGDLPLSSGWS